MKLVENIAPIEVIETENGDKKIKAISAYAFKTNDNNLFLNGDVVEMKREKYPFLFNHGKSADDLLGQTVTHYDNELRAYVSDIEVYDSKKDIIKAISNGVYDSVSIAYYIDSYEFGSENEVVVNHAILNEISLVSVGADSEAKLINNELETERQAFIAEKKELEDIKKAYE